MLSWGSRSLGSAKKLGRPPENAGVFPLGIFKIPYMKTASGYVGTLRKTGDPPGNLNREGITNN